MNFQFDAFVRIYRVYNHNDHDNDKNISSIAKKFPLVPLLSFYHSTSDLCNLWSVLCQFSFAIYKFYINEFTQHTSFYLRLLSPVRYIFFLKKIFHITSASAVCYFFIGQSSIPFHRFTWIHLSFHMLLYILVVLSFLDVMCKPLSPFNTTFCVTPYISLYWVICKKMTDCFSEWFEYINKLHPVESLKTEWQSHTFKLD